MANVSTSSIIHSLSHVWIGFHYDIFVRMKAIKFIVELRHRGQLKKKAHQTMSNQFVPGVSYNLFFRYPEWTRTQSHPATSCLYQQREQRHLQSGRISPSIPPSEPQYRKKQ